MATRSTAVAKTTEAAPLRGTLLAKIGSRYSIEPEKMLATLKATAFKTGANEPVVTNEQMIALLVVADQYNLNPFTKEIYAFPDKQKGGIVPIVGVDGWIRIINEHPQLASIEFDYADDGSWIECTITRKDRERPVRVREHLAECKRTTIPWNSHPQRMLRHKALIQCARVAFGFAGIHDPDEGEVILASTGDLLPVGKPATEAPKAKADALPAPANDEQLKLIRQKIDATGIPENETCEQFGVAALEELKFDQVHEVLAWLDRHAP